MRVLIVDDEEISRAVVRATLEQVASSISEVDDGVDALRVAMEQRPDLVILDVMMPGVDGYEVCYLIKTAPELRHTRVIMLTARDDDAGISTGKGAYADAYLLKPLEPDQLLAAIRDIQEGKRPYPTGRA